MTRIKNKRAKRANLQIGKHQVDENTSQIERFNGKRCER